ncbi:MAG: pitrilysin family protein, partial [Pseudomonadota bacterium]
MRSLLLTLLLFFITTPAFAKIFNAETYTLENGLEVVVIPNDRVPVVTHMIWYKVGAADEPVKKSGMAHYLEHLMFKGTDTLEAGEFSRIVRELGGQDNAFTGQDYTAYHQTIAKEHLEKMMTMEADRMINLKVSEDHFVSEKSVVIEERKQRTENDPRALFTEQMRSTLHVNHPYGTPVIGWMDEIENLQWNDIKTFYETWYAPNNAVLIISGDVTLEEIKPMIERTYGVIEKKELPDRTRAQTPPAIGESKMKLRHERIKQLSFQSSRLGPNYSDNKQDSLALDVLVEILDGGPTTRLYKNLVVDQKIATSVSMSYMSGVIDNGAIWLSGIPSDNISLEELEDAINDEIQNVINNGVTEQELKDAIQRLQDSAVFARDSVSGPARIFGYTLTTGSTVDDIENWPELIGGVTAEQVQKAA